MTSQELGGSETSILCLSYKRIFYFEMHASQAFNLSQYVLEDDVLFFRAYFWISPQSTSISESKHVQAENSPRESKQAGCVIVSYSHTSTQLLFPYNHSNELQEYIQSW